MDVRKLAEMAHLYIRASVRQEEILAATEEIRALTVMIDVEYNAFFNHHDTILKLKKTEGILASILKGRGRVEEPVEKAEKIEESIPSSPIKKRRIVAHQNPPLPPPPATSLHDYWGQGQQWHQGSQYGSYNATAPHAFDADGKPFNYEVKDEVIGWHRHPFGDFYAEASEDPQG